MTEHLIEKLTVVVVLAISAQWLAWRLRLPSILLLLLCGFVAGPVTGWLDPDQFIGQWLMPLVSLSVGLILFEGGLTLKFHELKKTGRVIRKLITLGALITWVLSTLAAWWCFNWPFELALLIGAILVVTGPTVIMPLLRHVQPTRTVASTLKWEGILIDPLGALLALLVYEAIVAQNLGDVPLLALAAFGKTLGVGILLGMFGAGILVLFLRRHWIPDFLENPITLMLVVAAFAVSNYVQSESGLLTVTLMGVAVANQKWVTVRQIIAFKETLRVLLISLLFVLLAARVQVGQVQSLTFLSSAAFLGVLMFVARPLSVLVSTAGSEMSLSEKAFLCWMAPRGIVAAAVTSLFAFRLEAAGYAQAEELVPVVFLVIVGTVSIYGLTALPLARRLNLSKPNPQGILFVGANSVARAIARVVQQEGHAVVLADTNPTALSAARMDGLPVYSGSAISDSALEELDLAGIGRLFALTPNAEVNSLSVLQYGPIFGRANVFHLPPAATGVTVGKANLPSELQGRRLFAMEFTLDDFERQLAIGGVIKKTKITTEFTFEQFQQRYGKSAVPLLVANEPGDLSVVVAGSSPKLKPGQTLFALVDPASESTNSRLVPDPKNPSSTK